VNVAGCNEKRRPNRRRALMPDLIFIGVVVLFLAVSAGYIRFCERL
jgi:hypothetical protein